MRFRFPPPPPYLSDPLCLACFFHILKAMKHSQKQIISLIAPFLLFPCVFLIFSCAKKASGIGGLVLDGSGKPIANVKVMALQERPVTGYAKLETSTDAEGRFVLRGCYPGSDYKLLIHAEGTDLRDMTVRTGVAGTETQLPSPVVFRFLSSPEGIILDTKTGLHWAIDSGKTVTWQQAGQYAKMLRLGGFDDWRLPTRVELESLGKIDADFPVAECCAWSSEAAGIKRAWFVDLYRSFEDTALKSNDSYSALAVRRSR
jgi:hypothetical protein